MSNKIELLKEYLNKYYSDDLKSLENKHNDRFVPPDKLFDYLYNNIEYKQSGYETDDPLIRSSYDKLLTTSKKVSFILEQYQSLNIDFPEQLKKAVDIYELIPRIGKEPLEESTKLLQTYIDGQVKRGDIEKHIKELDDAKRERRRSSGSYDPQYLEYNKGMKEIDKNIETVKKIPADKLQTILKPIIEKYNLDEDSIYFHKESFDIKDIEVKIKAGQKFKIKSRSELYKLNGAKGLELELNKEYDEAVFSAQSSQSQEGGYTLFDHNMSGGGIKEMRGGDPEEEKKIEILSEKISRNKQTLELFDEENIKGKEVYRLRKDTEELEKYLIILLDTNKIPKPESVLGSKHINDQIKLLEGDNEDRVAMINALNGEK